METKRSYSVMNAVHPTRKSRVPGSTRPSKKPRKIEPPAYKKQMHTSSVNVIKKRIRDVKRRLERSQNLPATIRMEDERALAAYEQELAAADEEKTRQKMIKKYHMVRFFERQKATRQLRKLRKLLLEAQSDKEVNTIKAKMHVAEVDLNYTQYYPLDHRYISLYPPKEVDSKEASHQDDQAEDPARKPPMWAEVEKRMVDGTLNHLRNSSSAINSIRGKSRRSEVQPAKSKDVTIGTELNRGSVKQSQTFEKPKNNPKRPPDNNLDYGKRKGHQNTTEVSDGDDESDEGFFEE